jgi:uncharacterized membrane protein
MSNSQRWISVALGTVLVLYPLLVYLGLAFVGPRWLAGLLLCIALGKLAFNRAMGLPIGNTGWLLLAAAIATAITLVSGSVFGLKCYPVLANGLMLILFGVSLWRPPSMIERFARLQHPDLPPTAISYTRKVTWVWCVFFAVNGSIATATIFASESVWALYNGFIAYVLMGALLAGEYGIRLLVQRKNSRIKNDQADNDIT